MRISDWSSDVCSSDLERGPGESAHARQAGEGCEGRSQAPGKGERARHNGQARSLRRKSETGGTAQAGHRRQGIATAIRPFACLKIRYSCGTRKSEKRREGEECDSTCRSQELHAI